MSSSSAGDEEIVGRIVHPTNRDDRVSGSIHDDATASTLGFRGGTVAGSVHLDTLVPLCVDVFGPSWFERGTVSMYFRHPTTDGEPTRARLTPTQTRDQFDAAVETPERIVVGEGTVGLGDHGRTALSRRDLLDEPADRRILAGVRTGETFGPITGRVDTTRYHERCERGLLTEVHDWYLTESPWGGSVLAPSAAVSLFSDAAAAALLPRIAAAVGMWGALEVAHCAGPLRTGIDYELSGKVLAISVSPKTEVCWYDLAAAHAGATVATARICTRFVKASSPLWSS